MPEMNPELAHEALDRTHLLRDMIGSYLAEHPYVNANPDVASYIEEAAMALGDAYQLIGRKIADGQSN